MKSLDFEDLKGDCRGANDGRDDKQTETRPDKSEIYICTFHVLPRFLLPRMFQKYAISRCLHGKFLNFSYKAILIFN